MPEVWLRTNSRGLAFATIVPALVVLVGSLLASGVVWDHWAIRVPAGILAALGLVILLVLLYLMRLPRLAYEDGALLVYLRSLGPIRVPIEIVECFFSGEADSKIVGGRDNPAKAATVVVRLAERAKPWHKVDVNQALGNWDDGYIVIRGTWCEPLNLDLVKRMNRQLADVHRQRRAEAAAAEASAQEAAP